MLDVEPGQTWIPDSHAVRKAVGRPVAVIAGLECYYYQPIDVVRWRTYEALRQGANGIGICPSGMLQYRPETISFLRGLYAEVQALQGMLAGKAPSMAAESSTTAITFWEKQDGKIRYLVAMTGSKAPAPNNREATFTLPIKTAKVDVLFEGRSVPVVNKQFTEAFADPYMVRVYRFVEE